LRDDAGETQPQSGGQGSGFGVQQGIKPRRAPSEGGSVAEKGTNSETAQSAPGSAGGVATATKPQAKRPFAPNGHANGHANGHSHDISAAVLARAGVLLKDAGPNTARSEQFADFQSDAPACDNCGAITVRNGNCYLCHNCGSSMGCS
jgi:ribonucleoside-diphosphate reductase alpha chain